MLKPWMTSKSHPDDIGQYNYSSLDRGLQTAGWDQGAGKNKSGVKKH